MHAYLCVYTICGHERHISICWILQQEANAIHEKKTTFYLKKDNNNWNPFPMGKIRKSSNMFFFYLILPLSLFSFQQSNERITGYRQWKVTFKLCVFFRWICNFFVCGSEVEGGQMKT